MPRPGSRKTALIRSFDETDALIYVVGQDGVFLFLNQAVGDALQMELDALLGARCQFQPAAEGPQERYHRLCPPPSAFETDATSMVVQLSPAKTYQAHFQRLGGGDSGRVLAVLQPITSTMTDGSARMVQTAPELHHTIQRLQDQLRQEFQQSALLGKSASIQRVRSVIEIAANNQASLTVIGPRGSGREHVARTIHALGAGEGDSMVPLAAPLLDAELVATTMEAFMRRCAELASESIPTLLLLEADQLPQDAQQRLLEFLAVGELGLRVVATARISLRAIAERGDFLLALANRLSTFELELPPLCERPEDIAILAQNFVEQHNVGQTRQIEGFDREAIEWLVAYPWPGNIDELREVVEAAVERLPDGQTTMGPPQLPIKIRAGVDASLNPRLPPETIDLEAHLAGIESSILVEFLRRSGGNKTQAAKALGIHRTKLIRRIEQLKIDLHSLE